MARIIFKCPHMKALPQNKQHRETYTTYIATREGVVAYSPEKRTLDATMKQKQLISQMVVALPETTELFEYEDYLKNPTRENASEFISAAAEHEFIYAGDRGVFLSYMATRPGVVKQGTHGLFSSTDQPIALQAAAREIAEHPGTVWMPIISLRREDANRLGYDNPKNWRDLIMRQAHDMAKAMKIDPKDFKWYAAFHNEGHHPHIHMVCYSQDPRKGFLTVPGIRHIKAKLAHDIFRQDLISIYEDQTEHRQETVAVFQDQMRQLARQMVGGTLDNPQVTELMDKLVQRLKLHGGKRVYGYLRPPVKAIVDQIVDEVAKDPRVAVAYEKWIVDRQRVVSTYTLEPESRIPLSKQKEFKRIRNVVIEEAVNILEGNIVLEGLPSDADNQEPSETRVERGNTPPVSVADVEMAPSPTRAGRGSGVTYPKAADDKYYLEWNPEYREARLFLYGNKVHDPDFDKAYQAMHKEGKAGNALALFDLGRMCANGLGCAKDTDVSYNWYSQALEAFEYCYQRTEHPYIEYRLGKMYVSGIGTEPDEAKGAMWLEKAAARGNKYAQYTLGTLYRDGCGVEKCPEKAFSLFEQSTLQDMPYAEFEVGRMYRDGNGIIKDAELAAEHFENAYMGFSAIAEENNSDTLQYRIGWMLLTGTGVEKDERTAEEYFIKAAMLDNVHAKYQLAKMYLARPDLDHSTFHQAIEWMREAAMDNNHFAEYALGKVYLESPMAYKPNAAIYWLTKAATAGNEYAQYKLGKLFLGNEHVPVNVGTALQWLTMSAEQNNEYALHSLGKLYSDETLLPADLQLAAHWFERAAKLGNEHSMYRLGKLLLEQGEDSIDQALHWLHAAAEKENQYAQYALGKIYLFATGVDRDEAVAKEWFTLSAAQGNIYAQYMLDHMDDWARGQAIMAGSRLLVAMGKIFNDKVPPPKSGRGHVMDRKRLQQLRQKGKARNSGQTILEQDDEYNTHHL